MLSKGIESGIVSSLQTAAENGLDLTSLSKDFTGFIGTLAVQTSQWVAVQQASRLSSKAGLPLEAANAGLLVVSLIAPTREISADGFMKGVASRTVSTGLTPLFDVVDIMLIAQGIPSGTLIKAIINGTPIKGGHSLGAADALISLQYGYTSCVELFALPLFVMGSPSKATVTNSWGDAVPLGPLTFIFHPASENPHLGWFEHSFDAFQEHNGKKQSIVSVK